MLVFVYAYEGMYQGLHGIYNQDVIEVSDDIEMAQKEINEWGNYESEELIYSYGLEDELDEGEDITESVYYSDRGWGAHKIRPDINLSLSELREKTGEYDRDGFIELYCEKECFV
jgi:tRNA splicing endonuclease